MSRFKNSVPDRWLDYKSVGKQVDVTPFLAFKVPLNELICEKIPLEQKFSPSDLMKQCPNLSLVVDLTNTKKYYNADVFRKNGIEYKKIFCPGHQLPPKNLVKKFFEIVDDFIKKRKNDSDEVHLIGVHCTHGINRTGFFICSYMINKMGYNSEQAILEFNSARGHHIERENYLRELKKYDTRPFGFQPLASNDESLITAFKSDTDTLGVDRRVNSFQQHGNRRKYSRDNNSVRPNFRSEERRYRNEVQHSHATRHNFNYHPVVERNRRDSALRQFDHRRDSFKAKQSLFSST